MENILSFLYLSSKDEITRSLEGTVCPTHPTYVSNVPLSVSSCFSSFKYQKNTILYQIIGTHASNLGRVEANKVILQIY